VKIVPRHVYLGDLDRFIDRIKTNAYAPVHSLIDFGRPSEPEKIGQRLVLERLDHMRCNRNVDDVSTICLQSRSQFVGWAKAPGAHASGGVPTNQRKDV
jgi:hypothetical protein